MYIFKEIKSIPQIFFPLLVCVWTSSTLPMLYWNHNWEWGPKIFRNPLFESVELFLLAGIILGIILTILTNLTNKRGIELYQFYRNNPKIMMTTFILPILLIFEVVGLNIFEIIPEMNIWINISIYLLNISLFSYLGVIVNKLHLENKSNAFSFKIKVIVYLTIVFSLFFFVILLPLYFTLNMDNLVLNIVFLEILQIFSACLVFSYLLLPSLE